MSANVEVVVRQFERFNARDFGAVADAYAEDVTLILNGLFAGRTETVTGKPAVLDWFGDVVFKEFVDSRFDVEESRGRGSGVLAARGRTLPRRAERVSCCCRAQQCVQSARLSEGVGASEQRSRLAADCRAQVLELA